MSESDPAAAELRAARTRLGLTQEQLAAAIGYSLRMVKYMESGERRIPRPAAILIQTLLDTQSVKNPTR